MSEGPTIGDWTQYGWIPDDASSFPARVRLRNAAWMVYYEPDVVVQRMQAENARLRELCASLFRLANNVCLSDMRRCDDCPMDRSEPPCALSRDFIAMRELGIDVTPWEVERVEVDE